MPTIRQGFSQAEIRWLLSTRLPLSAAGVETLARYRDGAERRVAHFEARWAALFRARRASAPTSPRFLRLSRLMRRAGDLIETAFCASLAADARIARAEQDFEAARRRRLADCAGREGGR